VKDYFRMRLGSDRAAKMADRDPPYGADPGYGFLMAAYFGLKDRLFPKLTFAIGRSADQAQYARYWRNLAPTSVIIGIFLKLTIDHLLK
jgi:hypothetical protein